MWTDLTALGVRPLDLAFRATVVYFAVLILLRIGGKRQLGQMGATEFVAILLISNAVQNAMNGGDNSLVGGLILAAVLIFMSWLVSVLTYRSRAFALLFEGTPTLLIHKGKAIRANLRKERITPSELRTMLRKQGLHNFHEIDSAVLESDGTISVLKPSDIESPVIFGD